MSCFDYILTVEEYLNGKRIDSFLVKHFRNYTPFRMQRIVRAEQVAIDGKTVGVQQRVFTGQQVSIRLIEPPDKLIEPEPIPVDVIFEDDWLVVVNKPSGQVAHPVGKFHSGTLSNALQHHFDLQTELPGLLRPGIVHRLDRQTSGVMVTTKHHLAHYRLGMAFEKSEVSKAYFALVEGVMTKEQGAIDLPIGRVNRDDSILMSAASDARQPRPACTNFRVVEQFDNYALVEAEPVTGKPHQIRIHLAAIGHPVVDDEFYGAFGSIKKQRDGQPTAPTNSESDSRDQSTEHPSMSRHALHAQKLSFQHPITGEQLTFTAPIPADILAFIEQIQTQHFQVHSHLNDRLHRDLTSPRTTSARH